MTDLHAILRDGTAALHDRVERTRLSRRVMAPDVTVDDYGAFLAATWRVLAPLADRLDRGGEAGDLAPLVAALEADLRQLGIATGAVPPGPDAPVEGTAGRLGALYVAEGSAMGGAVIAKHLCGCLGGGTVPASRYLGRAKADAGARWRAWRAAAAARAWDAAEAAAALRAATAVFEAFASSYGAPEADRMPAAAVQAATPGAGDRAPNRRART